MADNALCTRFVRGKVARFTKLDRCGAPEEGPWSTVVTEGIVTATYTPTMNAGTAITRDNAAGKRLISNVPVPVVDYYTVSLALIGVNPLLLHMLTGVDPWESPDPGVYSGFVLRDDVDGDYVRFASEQWHGVDGNVCSASGDEGWGYWLWPQLKGGTIGAVTWANDAIDLTIEGATTETPNDWGVGPYDVTLDALGGSGVASPLLRNLPTSAHWLSDVVYLAPPVDECGATPIGTKATTAASDGTYTGGYAPANLDDFTGVTASPTSAWTGTQHVTAYDGTQVKWNGTTWVLYT